MVSAFPRNFVVNDAIWEFQERLKTKSGGSLTINFRGGPEVAPQAEQIQSLRTGTFELMYSAGAFTTQLVPEGHLIDYIDGSLQELRAGGVVDHFDRLYQEKAGVKLLGVATSNVGYALYTKRPIQSIDDFKGLKMRSLPNYLPLIEALGASAVNLPTTEVYSALERGVVDGFGWPRIDFEGTKLYEVACCTLDPGFWTLRELFLMNMRAWERLSPEQQKLVLDTLAEYSQWADEHFQRKSAEEFERVQRAGLQVLRLPEAEARRLREIAYESPWSKWLPTVPQTGPRIQELATPLSKAWPPRDYQVLKTS